MRSEGTSSVKPLSFCTKKHGRPFPLWLMSLLLLFYSFPSFAQKNCVLIKLSQPPSALRKKTSGQANQTGIARVDAAFSALNVTRLSPICPEEFWYATDSRGLDGDVIFRWIKVLLPDSFEYASALRLLNQSPEIQDVQPNRVFHLDFVPNDQYIREQWALSKIAAFAAWDIERGAPQIPVAIIDTGIDYQHTDLAQNIWINSGEDINGNKIVDAGDSNGIDDDANGFIDDIRGWDFTDAPNYPDGGDFLDPDNDPLDESGHGTGVAGIIAAAANNGTGIAGLAHQCRLMPLRAFTSGGNGEEDDVASAILYAIHNGAKVINMSWGDVFVSRIIDDVIRYAAAKGVVMVASAGNSSTDQIHYPSGFAGTISVGATDEKDNLAGFSNYGPTIDLVAPGVNIFTTAIDNRYTTVNGTSFSAPYVSAAAALLLSKDSSLSAEVVRGILTRSTDDLGNHGWDSFFGAGRLNVATALSQPLYAVAKITSPKLDAGFNNGPIEIYGSAWSPMLDYYALSYGEGDNPDKWIEIAPQREARVLDDLLAVWDSIPSIEGAYAIRLRVQNRDGSSIEDFVRIFIDHTPAKISQVSLLPMIDGDHYSTLIQFQTDDLCEGSVLYRPQGSNEPFREVVMSYRTHELRYNLSQELISDQVEIKLQARNGAQLVTEDDNLGRYYTADLSSPPIDGVQFQQTELFIPFGHLLSKTADFSANGLPELIVGTDNASSLGLTKFYEFNGTNMHEVFATSTPLIPRDVGDADGDGKPELLCGFGYSSYLLESPQAGQFPSLPASQWEGDGTSQFWASRIADLDRDQKAEIIMRVVKPAQSGSVDQFEAWETVGDNQFAFVAAFPNPTAGANQNGVPRCQVGDFDGDGKEEILFGDSDGDVFIYENNGDNSFVATWQDRLPLEDSIDYLSVGDYDGDGILEIAAGCHSDPNLNTEHYYDSRHWYYRVYDSTGDNLFATVAEWRFFGFESPKDFASGISSGDVDGDGRDEVLLCLFPDFYIVDYSPENLYTVAYHQAPIQSNGAIIVDSNTDGRKEFWVGDGETTRAFVGIGASSAPAAPVGISAKPLDEAQVILNWRAVPDADQYIVYRGADANHLVAYDYTSEPSFIDDSVQSDELYHYAVVTIDMDKSPNFSSQSRIVSARPGKRPFVLSAAMESIESVRLSFSEPMNESIKLPANYLFSENLGRPTSVIHDASGRQVVLSLTKPFSQQGAYSLTTYHLEDTDGTPMDTTRNMMTFTVILPKSTPYLVDGELLGGNAIELVFSESMEQSSIELTSNYDLSPDAQVQTARFSAGSNDRVHLNISPKKPLGALGKTYTVRVKNVISASGMSIEPGRGDFLQLIFAKTHLADVFTYPNPFHPQDGVNAITFANLTREADIRILTIDGQLVRTLHEDNGDGGVEWDLRDENGKDVAAGVYLYRVESSKQSAMGKLAILR